MFYGRMREYDIERPKYEKDKFGYPKTEYLNIGKERLYITIQDRTMININDLDLITGQYVAFADGGCQIRENDRIDGRFIVKSVVQFRSCVVLYLRTYEDGRVED